MSLDGQAWANCTDTDQTPQNAAYTICDLSCRVYISCGWWGGGRGKGEWGNLVVIMERVCGVRASVSKPTPFIYLTFEKNPKKTKKKKTKRIHTLSSEMLTYLILYQFIAGSQTNIEVIHWILREQAASKNHWAKKYVHIPGCQKSGAFAHTNDEKSGQ